MQKKELQRAGKEKEQVHNKKPESLARKKRIWIFFVAGSSSEETGRRSIFLQNLWD